MEELCNFYWFIFSKASRRSQDFSGTTRPICWSSQGLCKKVLSSEPEELFGKKIKNSFYSQFKNIFRKFWTFMWTKFY